MFCARCGQQIPDATEICPLCGREASIRLDPPPAAPPSTTAAAPGQIQWPDERETIMPPARQPSLRGVGGWLLFFCILLTVVAPLAVFVSAWRGGFEADDIVNIGWAAFGVVVGMMVWNVHRHAFVLLWIYFGLTILIFALAIVGVVLADEKADVNEGIPLFRSLVYTIGWFIYFKGPTAYKRRLDAICNSIQPSAVCTQPRQLHSHSSSTFHRSRIFAGYFLRFGAEC